MTPPQERPPALFPLTVVTGFLGAGSDPALAGTLVIVNEFTAPAWFLFCATWNRLSSKSCGRR
jgi:hypothetical protein